MADLRDELAAVQRETVSAAQVQRAIALFDPVWDLLLVPEQFRSRSAHITFLRLAFRQHSREARHRSAPLRVHRDSLEGARRPRDQKLASTDANAREPAS